MEIIDLEIPDVKLIQPKVHSDSRGYFFETFRQDQLEQKLEYKVNFIQDNESKSTCGVLRGLHFQTPPFAQSKLVRVIEGNVLDVAVDIRKKSPYFGQSIVIELNSVNKKQLFIPKGFAHGFLVLSKIAILAYKVDQYYSKEHDKGVIYNDSYLNIHWQLASDKLVLSEKDLNLPCFSDIGDYFDFGVNYYE